MATSAPNSAQPRAASVPIPVGPEAPVTMTTFPLREKRSLREVEAGTGIGILKAVNLMDEKVQICIGTASISTGEE